MIMKRIVLIVPVVFLAGAVLFGATESAGTGREVTVMFWNMENFFDFKDDGTGESDAPLQKPFCGREAER